MCTPRDSCTPLKADFRFGWELRDPPADKAEHFVGEEHILLCYTGFIIAAHRIAHSISLVCAKRAHRNTSKLGGQILCVARQAGVSSCPVSLQNCEPE